jgi:hypothetical protein
MGESARHGQLGGIKQNNTNRRHDAADEFPAPTDRHPNACYDKEDHLHRFQGGQLERIGSSLPNENEENNPNDKSRKEPGKPAYRNFQTKERHVK